MAFSARFLLISSFFAAIASALLSFFDLVGLVDLATLVALRDVPATEVTVGFGAASAGRAVGVTGSAFAFVPFALPPGCDGDPGFDVVFVEVPAHFAGAY